MILKYTTVTHLLFEKHQFCLSNVRITLLYLPLVYNMTITQCFQTLLKFGVESGIYFLSQKIRQQDTNTDLFLKNTNKGFPGGAVVENLPANAGDTCSSPGLGGSRMPRSSWARGARLLSLRVWSLRSEERRVGKECRSRWSPYH